MRLLIIWTIFAILPAALIAQVVNVDTASKASDPRPFGKYLVQICTLADGCSSQAVPPAEKTPQKITIKQVGCAGGVKPCNDKPTYPLPDGMPFFIEAKSDSGLDVAQKVVSGHVTPFGLPSHGVQKYQVDKPGKIVIKANQDGNGDYAPATPIELVLAVASGTSGDSGLTCSGLFGPDSPTQVQPQIDVKGIIALIGNPTPFVLTPQGDNSIFIYSTRFPKKNGEEAEILKSIVTRIDELRGLTAASVGVTIGTPQPFSVELSIPHAAALGDLATRIGGLNYSSFTVQDIGNDRVRISAAAQPDCKTWTAFLTAIRHMEWQVTPEPFNLKLYYLSSTDVAAAYTSLAGAQPAAAPAASPASTPPAAPSSGGGSPAGAATISVNQPPGSVFELKSDTTPCVVAGLTLSNSAACAAASASGGGASASPSSAAAVTPPAPKPPAMAAMAVAAGTVEQNPSDLLVFSDASPGDDAQITERKRVLAQLDLPRPEMLINAWVMQDSTASPSAMGKFSRLVRDLVANYNDAVMDVERKGWVFLRRRIHEGKFFNEPFYHYVADTYVADTYSASTPSGPQDAAQKFLDTSMAHLADRPETRTTDFGICKIKRYCLGYYDLFQPLKPRLTDFLLTLISADDPVVETNHAIAVVEGKSEDHAFTIPPGDPAIVYPCGADHGTPRVLRERCRAIWTNLGLDRERTAPSGSCAAADYLEILDALIGQPPNPEVPAVDPPFPPGPRVYLACFQHAVNQYMVAAPLLRAALADFLFNYKMSQQYPHEFVAYDLSQSADALNAALAPLIDAFNRDIVAFQVFMRADVQYQVDRLNNDGDERCCVKRLFGLDKPSFFNDGIVSVRTISGQPTTVSTTSQSFLDASAAPTLANLANNIANPAGGASGNSPVATVLGAGTQGGASLLSGVLNSYQTTYAQIGRALSLNVTPRSLSTASSAEIAVTLNADDAAGGPTYSGGPTGGAQPNTSHVASHDTTTRVRVESVKLFEISSFSAIVERSRSKFPLLPPFVEIPYIGTILGIPIPAAKEYHASAAIMSAMVVPTAADIAYGLKFRMDQVVDGDAGACSYIVGSAGPDVTKPCRFRRAVALSDLNRNPIRNFHKAMITCLGTKRDPHPPLASSTDTSTPYTSSGSLITPPTGACDKLTFDGVPHVAY